MGNMIKLAKIDNINPWDKNLERIIGFDNSGKRKKLITKALQRTDMVSFAHDKDNACRFVVPHEEDYYIAIPAYAKVQKIYKYNGTDYEAIGSRSDFYASSEFDIFSKKMERKNVLAKLANGKVGNNIEDMLDAVKLYADHKGEKVELTKHNTYIRPSWNIYMPCYDRATKKVVCEPLKRGVYCVENNVDAILGARSYFLGLTAGMPYILHNVQENDLFYGKARLYRNGKEASEMYTSLKELVANLSEQDCGNIEESFDIMDSELYIEK